MLQCHVKGCDDSSKNFPLKLENCQLEEIEAERNNEFLVRMYPRVDWNALRTSCQQLGINKLPEEAPENIEDNEPVLEALHSLLLETNVLEGQMVCNGCGHIYPIRNSVPNMLLAEHEI
ncbi:Multifunctional methyltransferase subunit [Smittium mucronatum]|uniref:Multifunctional methyltransferase subunit n=1 Tax=Smittium mucronatum TaxID=133383 RepID=A0A1R0GLP0_9FUNG|nr:Multifunctional methyltransferase subunit [Smittium mucronatum]